jgi:CheY-like chemotaxis protein
MTVSSGVGSGTIFNFAIQVQLARETEISSSSMTRRIVGLEPNQPQYRILVVEDVGENRRLLFELFSSVGFAVATADNGQEAIALCQAWPPHLILMDMLMPVMDGYETARRIKATPSGRETVIIAITANAFLDDRAKSLAAGCDDFIPKPYQETLLFEKIAQHLGVDYRYEDQTFTKSSPVTSTLIPADLQVMPLSWNAELHQAALALDHTRIIELIEQIPSDKMDLMKSLLTLVDNFSLDIIFDTTQAVLERKHSATSE